MIPSGPAEAANPAVSKARRVIPARSSFLASLSFEDLQRLRHVVLRETLWRYPPHRRTTREADRIIEAMGPQVAERMIERAVNARWQEWSHGMSYRRTYR